jgi:hypothetical protein
MAESFDVFILNKFGKQESDGRGFRDLVGEAVGQGATVIVGVNGMNVAAFDAFAGGLATYLRPDPEAILSWIERCQGSVGTAA